MYQNNFLFFENLFLTSVYQNNTKTQKKYFEAKKNKKISKV
jgi:hypothetical protein